MCARVRASSFSDGSRYGIVALTSASLGECLVLAELEDLGNEFSMLQRYQDRWLVGEPLWALQLKGGGGGGGSGR